MSLVKSINPTKCTNPPTFSKKFPGSNIPKLIMVDGLACPYPLHHGGAFIISPFKSFYFFSSDLMCPKMPLLNMEQSVTNLLRKA